jgi:hypothetical protein
VQVPEQLLETKWIKKTDVTKKVKMLYKAQPVKAALFLSGIKIAMRDALLLSYFLLQWLQPFIIL